MNIKRDILGTFDMLHANSKILQCCEISNTVNSSVNSQDRYYICACLSYENVLFLCVIFVCDKMHFMKLINKNNAALVYLAYILQ